MKSNSNEKQPEQQLPLKRLVNALLTVKLEEVVKRNSFFINEIQSWLPLNANQDVVTRVLDNLFRNVLSESNFSCIRVSAKEYSQVMLIHIYNSHESDCRAKELVSSQIREDAGKIGGYVGITRQEKNQTVIAFSFPNVPAAA